MLKKTIRSAATRTFSQKPRTVAELERDRKQLVRLERLIDFIFAILIWQLFQNLPVPSKSEFDLLSNFELVNLYKNSFIMILIGAFLIITYWGQNNRIFGNLARTDGRHAVLSLLQLFSCCCTCIPLFLKWNSSNIPLLLQHRALCLH